MLELERMEQILTILRANHTVKVKTLTKQLFVSEATVRRDLIALEKQGLIKRLHGGAALLDAATGEIPLYTRQQENTEAKKIITTEAARYLKDGQVIFLDASSTVMFLIPFFENFNHLTIVTNGLNTANEMKTLPHKVYCTGGLLLHHSSAYVGDYAAEFVRHFNADLFFFSSRGLSEDGKITDSSAEETYIRKIMFEQSREKYFLCDHKKFGKTYCYNLCTIDQVDKTIFDRPFP